MADIETSVLTWLTTSTNVNKFTSGQIYPDVAPQGTRLPWVTFTDVTDDPDHHMQGASGLSLALIQIDVWAASSVDRRTLANYIKNRMDGVISATIAGLSVDSIMLQRRKNSYESPPDGSESGVFRQMMEFTFKYREPLPTLT